MAGRKIPHSVELAMITSEDIANIIAFLCSPLAVSITGEVIAAMGGSSKEIHL